MQVEINYKKMWYLLKNKPTVKQGAALFKMASMKKLWNLFILFIYLFYNYTNLNHEYNVHDKLSN